MHISKTFFTECQNLASQMVENNISPIAYSLQLQNRTLMKNNTAEVLRNVKLLEQEKIIICSPRDEMYKLIQLVLDEVLTCQLYNHSPADKVESTFSQHFSTAVHQCLDLMLLQQFYFTTTGVYKLFVSVT